MQINIYIFNLDFLLIILNLYYIFLCFYKFKMLLIVMRQQ